MRFFERFTSFWKYVEITHTSPADIVDPSPEMASQSQADEFQDAIAELKDAMRKLGRNQLRANTVSQSDRNEIKQILQQVVVSSTEPHKEMLLELLLVVDGLEEGIHAIRQLNDENRPVSAWAEGFLIVHERLLGILKKWDVAPIESVAQPFVPHLHQAVDMVDTVDVVENVIVEEQRRGYLRGNKVLRYAEVVVARKKGEIGEANYRH